MIKFRNAKSRMRVLVLKQAELEKNPRKTTALWKSKYICLIYIHWQFVYLDLNFVRHREDIS